MHVTGHSPDQVFQVPNWCLWTHCPVPNSYTHVMCWRCVWPCRIAGCEVPVSVKCHSAFGINEFSACRHSLCLPYTTLSLLVLAQRELVQRTLLWREWVTVCPSGPCSLRRMAVRFIFILLWAMKFHELLTPTVYSLACARSKIETSEKCIWSFFKPQI